MQKGGLAHLASLTAARALQLMRGHTKDITCMQLVNKLLYTGSVDADAKCFVTEFGDCTRTYTGQTNTISCLKFHQGIRE